MMSKNVVYNRIVQVDMTDLHGFDVEGKLNLSHCTASLQAE